MTKTKLYSLFINFAYMKTIYSFLSIILIYIIYPTTTFAQEIYPEDIQCEDTCTHIHGIDMSHYQGEVFWDAIGNNKKMAYVYLKATEGGDNIDEKYEYLAVY